MLANLAELALEEGRIDDAAVHGRQVLALAHRIGAREDMLHALAYLACAAARTGDARRAGRLWGALEAEHARRPGRAWPRALDQYAPQVLAHAQPQLRNGLNEGRQLTLHTAVEEALANETDPATHPPGAHAYPATEQDRARPRPHEWWSCRTPAARYLGSADRGLLAWSTCPGEPSSPAESCHAAGVRSIRDATARRPGPTGRPWVV